MAKAQQLPTSDDVFDFAPGWQPEPGDMITGELIKRDRGENQWGPYNIITLRVETPTRVRDRSTDSGTRMVEPGEEVSVHAFHAVLDRLLRRMRPPMNCRLALKYLGEIERKRGGGKLSDPFHGYQGKRLDLNEDDFWGSAPQGKDDEFSDEPPF